MQRLEMQNFNGLQQWNTEVDRLKALLQLEIEMGDPEELATQLRLDLRAHLKNPFVKKLCVDSVSRVGATPTSANLHRVEATQIPLSSAASSAASSSTATESNSLNLDWEESVNFG